MFAYTLIPHFSISPNSVTLFNLPEQSYYKNHRNKGWENLKDNTNRYGDLSEASRKRLRKKIDFMLYLTNQKLIKTKHYQRLKPSQHTQYVSKESYKQAVKYKLTFITLTLPAKQMHSDKTLKNKCLNQFLIELKTNLSVNQYIWKAEKQENGNLHFHILTDKYIHWTKIRSSWNRIINKLDYVNTYQKNMLSYFKDGFKLSQNPKDSRSKEQQYRAYTTGLTSNFSNPNTTDIHALYKVKNLSAYISKYLAKGVTKTERIIKINRLTDFLENYSTKKKEELQKLPLTDLHSKEYKKIIYQLKTIKTQEDKALKELKALQEQGIEGRLYGNSQSLSKCKNLLGVGTENNIVDFDIIEKTYTNSYVHTVGQQKIIVLYFNINKTIHLKALFDKHLEHLMMNN